MLEQVGGVLAVELVLTGAGKGAVDRFRNLPDPGSCKELRVLGFHGSKASYELRKICMDHVYQKYGTEMAVSISGDDIRTITKYYADPAQPNLGAVRIVDLL